MHTIHKSIAFIYVNQKLLLFYTSIAFSCHSKHSHTAAQTKKKTHKQTAAHCSSVIQNLRPPTPVIRVTAPQAMTDSCHHTYIVYTAATKNGPLKYKLPILCYYYGQCICNMCFSYCLSYCAYKCELDTCLSSQI